MAMRMSGLMSGMDTESLISQLVEARSTKVNKTKKAQTKLEWKQDAWKDLNTKLKNLQSKFLSNMRFTTAYSKKVTKVSNPNAVSVITGENAVNGVQSLEINQLAKTGYLTGAELKVKDADGRDTDVKGDYTALTTLGELKFSGSGTFSAKVGDKNVDIDVTADTMISDVLNKLKEAGLNANFDAKSQRFFVSAKTSGKAGDFSITASDADGARALAALGLQTSISGDLSKIDQATYNQYDKYAKYNVAGDKDATIAKIKRESTLISDEVEARKNAYLEQYKSLDGQLMAARKKVQELDTKYASEPLQTAADYEKLLNGEDGESGINAQIKTIEDAIASGNLTAEEVRTNETQLVSLKEQKAALEEKKADAETYAAQKKLTEDLPGELTKISANITVTKVEQADGTYTYSANATNKLNTDVEDNFYKKVSYAAGVLNGTESLGAAGATKVSGQDAEITLNGAAFTSNTNTFEINGLTFTALAETKAGESITVTTEQDTDGIYDMVKSFIKEYNSIVNEMDRLYNAESAKGYEPLLDDEKQAMSDSEVEKYEKKIKDALLRRDSNLSDISFGMRSAMSAGIEVGGKTMYLYDFGIDLLGYFNAPDNEKNAYHIDGDPDDSDTAGKADKLKSMIASDPDTVISFFTKLAQNLYGKMSDMSKSVDGYRSFGSFYDDKKMKSDYNDYKTKIADLEEKLNKYEDSWYKKFSKMETAMAKMQQNANAIGGLLGGGS